MPRRRSIVPKLTHHKGSGQARVRIAGRDFYLGTYGTPEADEAYRRLVAEYLLTGNLPKPVSAAPADPGTTVADLVLAFWKHAQTYYIKDGQPTGEQAAIRCSLRPLRELYGSTPAADFGPLKLKALRDDMIRRGWCRTLVNARIRRVKLCFKWGVGSELVPPSVHHGLTAVGGLRRGRSEAVESKPVLPVDAATVEATLRHLNRQVAAMVRLQCLAGMRPGEVCQMRPCDLNRDGAVWEFRPASHKGQHHDRSRTIYIGPRGQAVLAPWLDRPDDAYCFSPAEAEAERRAALTANRRTPSSYGNRPGTNRRRRPQRRPGDHYITQSYGAAVRAAAVKAGLPVWSPNRLRHTAATAVRKAFGLEAAQVALGHASADVTQVYAERDAELARKVAADIG